MIDYIVNVLDQVDIVKIVIAEIAKINYLNIVQRQYDQSKKLNYIKKIRNRFFALVLKAGAIKNIVNVTKIKFNVHNYVDV